MGKRAHLVWGDQVALRDRVTFDIFKSAYSFFHRSTRANTVRDFGNPVVTHGTLLENWDVETRIILRAKQSAQDNVPTDNDDLGALLRAAWKSAPVEGILEHIDILPCCDLHDVPADRIDQITSVFIPFKNRRNDESSRWVEWDPDLMTPLGAHLLHTEDEVYQYCLNNEWYFPGHFSDAGKVVFAMKLVQDTGFFADIRDFWEAWVSSYPSDTLSTCRTSRQR
jgi:hypothetical protein